MGRDKWPHIQVIEQQRDHPKLLYNESQWVSDWISEPKIDDWFELFSNDWSWYGDFYNLFTIFVRLMFPDKHSLHSASIKSSGIYWMMMIH